MGAGFSVKTEELAQCGRRVSSMSSQADSLHGRASAAEVPSRSWGLLGELTKHGKYVDLQNQLTDHLSTMTTGLDNAGQRISNTADLYRETDEYHKKRIGEAGGLDGNSDPGKTAGGTEQHGGADGGGPVSGGGPVAGGPIGSGAKVGGAASYPPVEHGGLPPEKPLTPVDPGDGHQSLHGQITVEVKDPAYQHMSGTLLPDTAEEQA